MRKSHSPVYHEIAIVEANHMHVKLSISYSCLQYRVPPQVDYLVTYMYLRRKCIRGWVALNP